jgi:hypothetical protein
MPASNAPNRVSSEPADSSNPTGASAPPAAVTCAALVTRGRPVNSPSARAADAPRRRVAIDTL